MIKTKEELLEFLGSWENLSLITKEIGRHPEYFKMLMEISLYSTEPKSWRAAYIIDKIHENYPTLILPYIFDIIQQLKVEKHSRVQSKNT
ncbi:MAG: hypothetical protein L3J11_08680 [Draconibacterium sp.]|nr:hypothetical protein [Draconibacterium sp.]